PVQRRLGANDQLNEYIVHRSSGLFAVPPGIPDRPGRFIGDSLLD
ncbi:MAG: Dyp-type peroxidase, partial [Chloroflexi bacterium]|nr:Dyp-type peroxidase [Chloroflexota bacterium]